MRLISFKRNRFPPDVMRHAVWLYFRFTLSNRDVEELLAHRGVEVGRSLRQRAAVRISPGPPRGLRTGDAGTTLRQGRPAGQEASKAVRPWRSRLR